MLKGLSAAEVHRAACVNLEAPWEARDLCGPNEPHLKRKGRYSWSLTELIFSHNTLEVLGFAFDAVSNASICLNREARNNGVGRPFAIIDAALRSLGLMANVVVNREKIGHRIPSKGL